MEAPPSHWAALSAYGGVLCVAAKPMSKKAKALLVPKAAGCQGGNVSGFFFLRIWMAAGLVNNVGHGIASGLAQIEHGIADGMPCLRHEEAMP